MPGGIYLFFSQIVEDLNLVISIQRKFTYLQSIPGVFAMQRPYLPIQHPYSLKPNTQMVESQDSAISVYEKRQSTGLKRLFNDIAEDSPTKSFNLGWNTPQNDISGSTLWPVPPLLPSMSCSLGALLSKLPSVIPSYNSTDANDPAMLVNNNNNSTSQISGGNIKMESSLLDEFQEEKPSSINPSMGIDLGFGPVRDKGETQSAINLN